MKFSCFKNASLVLALASATGGCMGLMDGNDSKTRGAGSALNASSCQAKPLEVIVKGRENRFGIDGQQVALNPAIPMERVCKQVLSQCTATCLQAKAAAEATGIRGFQDSDPVRLRQMGELADTFNAAQGLQTNFKELGADEDEDAGAPTECNAKLLQVIVQGKEHRFGFDNRQVALNPAIPMQNICQGVNPACRALCDASRAAAIATGITGFSSADDAVKLRQMGELADDFNAALGNQTNFGAAGADAPGGDDNEGGGAQAPVQCKAKILQVIVKGREHRFGFDGRQVALNAAIPMQNICQALSGACRTACDAAKAEAIATGIKGFTGDDDAVKLRQMGELADRFNSTLGNPSNFRTNALVDR